MKPDDVIDQWTTVAVTPLPGGWRNVHAECEVVEVENGRVRRRYTGQVFARPCPAMLLQEHRETTDVFADDAAKFGRRYQRRREEPPYDTRVVFADDGDEVGQLRPVVDTVGYCCTVGPDDDLDDLSDEDRKAIVELAERI